MSPALHLRRQLVAKKLATLPTIQAFHGSATATENRLHVKDRSSGLTFLVDSGSVVSLLPRSAVPEPTPGQLAKQELSLTAANLSPIATYGRVVLTLNLGLRREYTWPFIIADIHSAIIGADLLGHAGLLPDLQKMCLVDSTTGLRSQGAQLAAVEHSVAILHDPGGDLAIRRQYDELLVEFAPLMRPNSRRANIQGAVVKHRIITKGPPVFDRPRPLHGERLKGARSAIKELTDRGVVRPSSSQWASPLHLVQKSPGVYRITGDYRGLNAVTEPDRYPLPIIEDLLHDCHGGIVFSVIDLEKAFYQIPMMEEDIAKTAVTTPFGLIEFLVMPLGLRNAPQTLQRFIDSLFRDLPFVRWYLDDAIIRSKDHREHLQHLRIVFKTLHDAGLTVNLKKCQIGQSEVDFLGYLVSQHGYRPPPRKVDAIDKIPRPTNYQELRSFLGMIDYYRRCTPKAAHIQAPLNDLLRGAPKRKKAKLPSWTTEHENAFNGCKEALRKATTNSFLAPDSELILYTDASDTAIGAALEQTIDGQQHPVGFFSRKLTDTERRYSTYDRELLAAYAAAKFFLRYLEGRTFEQRNIFYMLSNRTLARSLDTL